MYRPNIDYDTELEASVLGVFLIEPHSYGACYNLLTPECFYSPENLQVYQAIDAVFKSGTVIDFHTVARHFWDRKQVLIGHSNVAYFLTQLSRDVVTGAHMDTWCLMLRELAIKRATIALTSSGTKEGDPLAEAKRIEQELKRLTTIRATDDWQDVSQVAIRLTQRMDAQNGKELPGVTTSLSLLDQLNAGFRPGQLIIVAARPAVGKSAFMGRMVTKAAKSGKAAGVISLEMDSPDILARLAAAESGVPHWQIDRNYFYEAAQHRQVMEGISSLAALPIYFSDTAEVNMQDIRAKAEKLMHRHKLDILFIDYLQLVEAETAKGRNREQEVAQISRGCKTLAMSLKIPIVVLAQLNRQAVGEEPQLYHLRESGSLEQDADVVLMLQRDTETADKSVSSRATLFCRKWRNSSTSKVELGFDGERMHFYEASEVNSKDIF